jgi:DNA-binding CsgD family transcriptional regulator
MGSEVAPELSSFLRYLSSYPAPAAVARALVHGPLAIYGARSGGVLIRKDSDLCVLADYASPKSLLARYQVLPLSLDAPYTRAFLRGEILVTAGADLFSDYPAIAMDADLWGGSSQLSALVDLVSVPIHSQGVRLGVFGFIASTHQPWTPADFGLLEALAAVLGMWLTHPASGLGTTHAAASPASNEGTLQLSPRQSAILQLLEQGKTNDFIAVMLGVSVSTIKQEVQRLLRVLRSPDRKGAVQRAQAFGLLHGGNSLDSEAILGDHSPSAPLRDEENGRVL